MEFRKDDRMIGIEGHLVTVEGLAPADMKKSIRYMMDPLCWGC